MIFGIALYCPLRKARAAIAHETLGPLGATCPSGPEKHSGKMTVSQA